MCIIAKHQDTKSLIELEWKCKDLMASYVHEYEYVGSVFIAKALKATSVPLGTWLKQAMYSTSLWLNQLQSSNTHRGLNKQILVNNMHYCNATKINNSAYFKDLVEYYFFMKHSLQSVVNKLNLHFSTFLGKGKKLYTRHILLPQYWWTPT